MINEWYIYETSNDPTGYVVMKGKCGFELNNLNDAEALLKFLQELERENAKLKADLEEMEIQLIGCVRAAMMLRESVGLTTANGETDLHEVALLFKEARR